MKRAFYFTLVIVIVAIAFRTGQSALMPSSTPIAAPVSFRDSVPAANPPILPTAIPTSDPYTHRDFKLTSTSRFDVTVISAGQVIEGYLEESNGLKYTFWIEDAFQKKVYESGEVSGRHNFSKKVDRSGAYRLMVGNPSGSPKNMGISWRVTW